MTEKKKQVQTECGKGAHSFIVTKWIPSSGGKKAAEMRCQKCLKPISIEALEMMEFKQDNGMS